MTPTTTVRPTVHNLFKQEALRLLCLPVLCAEDMKVQTYEVITKLKEAHSSSEMFSRSINQESQASNKAGLRTQASPGLAES